jgi:hypothetical protein
MEIAQKHRHHCSPDREAALQSKRSFNLNPKLAPLLLQHSNSYFRFPDPHPLFKHPPKTCYYCTLILGSAALQGV